MDNTKCVYVKHSSCQNLFQLQLIIGYLVSCTLKCTQKEVCVCVCVWGGGGLCVTCISHVPAVSQLVSALSPVNHKGLHQG